MAKITNNHIQLFRNSTVLDNRTAAINKLNELNNELSCYNRDLQEEKLETEKLTDTLATLSDDKYMEEVARDKLGLVMPTEIIFMDASI